MKSLTLNLDKDLKYIATFDDNGYTKLNDVQLEAGFKMAPAKWIRHNVSWLKKLLPSHIYSNPYYTYRMGKNKGTYAVDKLLLAYVANNDNHWKHSLIDLLYTNIYNPDIYQGTYYSNSMAIPSDSLELFKRSVDRFNYTVATSNPEVAMKLKIDFIKWITGDTNIDEGEIMISSGDIPGITAYSNLLNRAATYFTLTPTYEGVSRLMSMGG